MSAPATTPKNIHSIVRFEFGEHYLVWYVGNQCEEYTDLEELLKYMEFVFHAARREYRPMVRLLHRIMRAGDLWQERVIRVLAVEPASSDARLFSTNVADWVNYVRDAVTMFNLTGNWNHVPDKLR